MKRFTCLFATTALLSFAGVAAAQQTPSSPSAAEQMQPMQQTQGQQRQTMQRRGTMLSASERKYLTQTAQDAVYEFISAQLAVQKAQNPQVVQYALKIMDDHAQFNKALMQLGRQKRVLLPVDLSTEDRTKLARLMQLRGTAFDQAYAQEVAKANATSIEETKRVSSTFKDQDVQAFIAQYSPLDQEHLQMANTLKSSISSNSRY